MQNAALEEKLAALLLAHQGEYLSGEAVSREIGVTRSAVWKAAGRLRQEGWILESGSNRGYRLAQVPDLVTAPVVEHFLPAPRSGAVHGMNKFAPPPHSAEGARPYMAEKDPLLEHVDNFQTSPSSPSAPFPGPAPCAPPGPATADRPARRSQRPARSTAAPAAPERTPPRFP